MTQFSISGERNGRHITITWEDGVLGGDDPDTVAWIKQWAEMLEGQVMGMLVGPKTRHNHLESPWSARSIITHVFPGKTTFEGKMPTIEVPPGAML
jgi:hypothetical protein